jgi:molecular chaperone GrpE
MDEPKEQEAPDNVIEKLQAENDDLKDTAQRLQAEFDNYRKRVLKDSENFTIYATEALISKLLPVLDTFDLALKAQPDQGMQMIRDQLMAVLEDAGLKAIDTQGKFNPSVHEVLLAQKSDKEAGTILEELQKGYSLGEKVLRHSKVKISKEE